MLWEFLTGFDWIVVAQLFFGGVFTYSLGTFVSRDMNTATEQKLGDELTFTFVIVTLLSALGMGSVFIKQGVNQNTVLTVLLYSMLLFGGMLYRSPGLFGTSIFHRRHRRYVEKTASEILRLMDHPSWQIVRDNIRMVVDEFIPRLQAKEKALQKEIASIQSRTRNLNRSNFLTQEGIEHTLKTLKTFRTQRELELKNCQSQLAGCTQFLEFVRVHVLHGDTSSIDSITVEVASLSQSVEDALQARAHADAELEESASMPAVQKSPARQTA